MPGIYLPELNADEMDLARDALIWHDEQRQCQPRPQACHNCPAVFAGAVCPICKEERPAFTALKRLTEERTRTPEQLAECRYYHGQPCNCGGRGVCLPAA